MIANGPDELINARPVLSTAAQGVLESRPFRGAFRDAAARAHRTLFSRDRDQLVLNIADAGAFVIDAVQAISPKTAKEIPKDIQPGLIELTESDFAIQTVQAAEGVRFLGLFVPGLGFLLLVGSVVVAPDRRRGVVTVSAAVAVAAAVGLIALVIGRSLLLGQFDDDVLRDAVDAAWGQYLGGLRTWFLGVGVAAIVLAAAATSTAREVDVAAPARRLRDLLLRTPEYDAVARDPRRVARGGERVRGAAAGPGGEHRRRRRRRLRALLRDHRDLLLVAPPPAVAPERVQFRDRVRPRAAIITGAAVVAAIVIAVVLLSGGGGPVKRPSGPVEACNGYKELCNRPLNEVAFPGAHNAMSAANADFITPNQETKIQDQLDAGIRVLLVDAYYGVKRSSGPVLTDLKREQGRTKVNETISEQFGKERGEAGAEHPGAGGGPAGRASRAPTSATSCASWARYR